MLKMVLLRPVKEGSDTPIEDTRFTVIEFIDANDDNDRAFEPLREGYVIVQAFHLTEYQSEVLYPTRNVGANPLVELIWPYEG